ncbi:hypothetical protein GIB67_027946 [Kingdonia uniflora]|uniref:Uncharacterized protein n=1 Tax=Kingdonia uniflora TaxID=39325 RepID=A0A7J7LGU4_9MAGN|nr:hypothetical protein GIB67_027946 [Kingdonia uniflora]
MATTMKRVDKIRQIVQLKQVMKRWKSMSLGRRSNPSDSDSDSDTTNPTRRIPSGFLPVYVGPDRKRFIIQTRFLNLPIFRSLLDETEEVFGFQPDGGLVLLCDVGFFKQVLKLLQKDEHRYRKMGLEEFVEMFGGVNSGNITITTLIANDSKMAVSVRRRYSFGTSNALAA